MIVNYLGEKAYGAFMTGLRAWLRKNFSRHPAGQEDLPHQPPPYDDQHGQGISDVSPSWPLKTATQETVG